MKEHSTTGTTAKHASDGKHGGTSKHAANARRSPARREGSPEATVVAKHAEHAKARKLSQGGAQRDLLRLWPVSGGEAEPRQPPGALPCLDARPLADVACCSALALAASLRLAGGVVGADDVAALHWLTAGGPDEGASIVAVLQAAQEHGLAACRPLTFGEVMPSDAGQQNSSATDNPGLRASRAGRQLAEFPAAALILGLELPGPHAVLAVGDTWWSWGRPWHRSAFPHAVIEEAWAVRWDV